MQVVSTESKRSVRGRSILCEVYSELSRRRCCKAHALNNNRIISMYKGFEKDHLVEEIFNGVEAYPSRCLLHLGS